MKFSRLTSKQAIMFNSWDRQCLGNHKILSIQNILIHRQAEPGGNAFGPHKRRHWGGALAPTNDAIHDGLWIDAANSYVYPKLLAYKLLTLVIPY